MKANELRIGNYINWQAEPVQIKDFTSFINIVTEMSKTYSLVRPIPLTEEWLIKLGYRKSTDERYYKEDSHYYPIYNRGIFYLFVGLPLETKECKYVHQLQNLYFALTGEELTIK